MAHSCILLLHKFLHYSFTIFCFEGEEVDAGGKQLKLDGGDNCYLEIIVVGCKLFVVC